MTLHANACYINNTGTAEFPSSCGHHNCLTRICVMQMHKRVVSHSITLRNERGNERFCLGIRGYRSPAHVYWQRVAERFLRSRKPPDGYSSRINKHVAARDPIVSHGTVFGLPTKSTGRANPLLPIVRVVAEMF